MKKIFYVIILFNTCILAMQKEAPSKAVAALEEEKQKNIERALACQEAKQEGQKQYDAFKQFQPQYLVSKEQMVKDLPSLFEYIPEPMHQSIVNYAEFNYGKSALQQLKERYEKEVSMLPWKWSALAYAYNTMPYFNKFTHFFHFEQSNPNGTILKGKREDYHLSLYVKLLNDVQKAHENMEEFGHLMDAMEIEYKSACNKPEADSKQCALIKKDLDEVRRNYREYSKKYQLANLKKIDLALNLAQEYKIHLMPAGDLAPTMVRLLEGLKNDPELQHLIAAFKVYAWPNFNLKKNDIIPRIVIYLAAGKENAQAGLNKLFVLLKDIKGLDIRPRFNAKVTDLIWVGQGDSLYKTDPKTQAYFEQPNKVYYRPDFTGTQQDYRLQHPETKKPIQY